MKILSIRFQNLNSLPSGEIDLERPPFAEAGLFAITGPTGAGKSTLLDAMTLALYGKAARYDNAPNPENMMRRHTGACQAETVFEVRGQRYRAEWQLRRARGRADGKLQPATRRIYDGREQVLAQNVTESDRLIEELTGLTYDRFLRSVLLAQGQFAQFFKASESQRAELLESLTGTAIYSELGALAFREAAAREQALDTRAAAIGGVILLTPEERLEKDAAIGYLDGELERLNRERAAAAERLEQGRRLAALAGEEEALGRQQAQLDRERADAAPGLEALARHRQGERFYPGLQTLDELLAQAGREAARLDEAREHANQARIRLASGFQAIRAVADEMLTGAEGNLARLLKEEADGRQRIAGLETELAQRRGDAGLDEVLPALAERLAGLASARAGLASNKAAMARLEAERQTAATRIESLQRELHTAGAAEQTAANAAREAASALEGLLKGRTSESLIAEAKKWEKKQANLAELRIAMEQRDRAAREGMALADQEAELERELAALKVQKEATDHEAHTQAHLLELAGNNLALLERIASFEEQRTQLAPGMPCPLCGALDHPLAKGGPPSREIEEARRHLAAAKAGNATAIKEAQLAGAHLARTEEALRNLVRRRADLRREQMNGHDAFERLASTLKIYTPEALEEAVAAIAQARADRDALLARLREAERRKADTELTHAQASALSARLCDAQAAAREALEAIEARLAEARQAEATFDKEIAVREDELGAMLTPFGLGLPGSGEETATRALLEKRFRSWQQLISGRDRLETELKQAALKIEAAQTQFAQLRKQAEPWVREAAVKLPSAPDPDLEARFRRGWEDLDDAAHGVEALRAELAARQAAVEEREKTWRGVSEAARRQEGEIRKALEGSPFDTVEALRSARLAPGPLAELERLRTRLDERSQTLAGKREQVRAQAEALIAAQAPRGEALAAAEAEWKRCDEAALAAAEQRAALKKELEEDTRRAEARQAQARELEEERQRFAPWAKLRELIGSADGRKFSRFAQGLSLEILLRHANRHLSRLSDRYELRRSPAGELALEIVDLHQAGTTRPTASLSGGESFLASLAMALGLSDLAGRNVRIDSLFIDEGFGSLDADTLDIALAALDTLRLNQKTVGIISHVESLKERIPVQIRVEKQAGGVSVLRMPWDR